MFGILSNPQKHRDRLGRPRGSASAQPSRRRPKQPPIASAASPPTTESWDQPPATSQLPGAPTSAPLRPNPSPLPAIAAASGSPSTPAQRPTSNPSTYIMPPPPPDGGDRGPLLDARCAYCNEIVGHFRDRPWQRITNSYFLHGGMGSEDGDAAQNGFLRPRGEPTQPLGSNKAFQSCLLQALECHHCHDSLAFKCIEAPYSKHYYRGRIFYRISKIIFEQPGGRRVEPTIDSTYFDKDASGSPAQRGSPSFRSYSNTPEPPNRDHSDASQPFSQADRDAVHGTNNGSLDWQEAHENWTHATRLNLSPAAFAKRIKDFGGGRNPKTLRALLPAPTPPPPGQPPPYGSGFPPVNSIGPPPHAPSHRLPQPQHMKHMEPLPPVRSLTPSHDSLGQQRLDINRIDEKLGSLQMTVDSLAQAVDRLSRQRSDRESLDLLSDTVSQLSSRIGDIDGLRLAMDSVKRRLRQLEDTDDEVTPLASTQQPQRSIYPSPHTEEIRQPSPKRQRVSEEHTNGGYQHRSANQQPALQPRPAGLVVSTQNDDSQASWRPVMRRSELASRRGRGRPRKHDSPHGHDVGESPPPWEHENWQASKGETDGFYNTIHLAQSADRGRIIRRGSGGGLGESIKRTRQKPVRNSEGILLRKDGKPDQRSISSPINLKKTLGKRKELLEHRPSSLSQEPNMDDTMDESKDDPDELSESSKPERANNEGSRDHSTVMKQMFPRGVEDDAKRLNHAANLFSPTRSPDKERVLPRNEMQQEEMSGRRSKSLEQDSNKPGSETQQGDAEPSQPRSPSKADDKDSAMTDVPAESTQSPSKSGDGEGAFAVPETPAEGSSLAPTPQDTQAPEKTGAAEPTRWRAVNESQESYQPEPSSESATTA